MMFWIIALIPAALLAMIAIVALVGMSTPADDDPE